MPDALRLSLRGISKRFENTLALAGVELDVAPGEVVGLIGENGAGKSTLAKIIAGVHQPTSGEIIVEGQRRVIQNVREAQSLGIAVVHQELNLVPHLSVESNVLLGREPWRVPVLRLNDNRALREEAAKALETVGLGVAPGTLVMDLSIAEQQRVEIAKALSLNARLLIMDEPTSSLSISEAEALLEVIAALRARGISVIYISHKLDEVRQVSDRIVVFRDGRKVAERPAFEASAESLVMAMVGRELSAMFPRREASCGETVLSVQGLVASGLKAPVSLKLRAGEVLGVAGLVGSGRSELLRGIFGASRRTAGVVERPGCGAVRCSPQAAICAGIAFVPEDRKTQGLLLKMAVRDNVALAVLRRLAHLSLRRQRAECDLADRFIQRLDIVVSSREQAVLSLSGGNQQKCLLAKWLATEPRVLLLDEPTRGIDVGAKHEVYRLIAEIAESGVGVMMVSSEMEEIIGMCDRALVMNDGRLAGELGRERLTEETIMALAAQTGTGSSGPESDEMN